jgi:DNA-binding GntR family transcriptional regulator
MHYKTIKDLVTEQLREGILSGKFAKPGEEFTLHDLAGRYKCSLTPIREALRTLEAEGLVVCNRHKPVKVSELEPDQIEKVFEVRMLLECHAAALATREIKETTLRNLEENIRQQQICLSGRNHQRWLQLNYEFHNQIYESANQPVLFELIAMLRARTAHYVRTYTFLLDRFAVAVTEHKEILNAILQKDGNRACRATKRHLDNLAKSLADFLKTKRDMSDLIKDNKSDFMRNRKLQKAKTHHTRDRMIQLEGKYS